MLFVLRFGLFQNIEQQECGFLSAQLPNLIDISLIITVQYSMNTFSAIKLKQLVYQQQNLFKDIIVVDETDGAVFRNLSLPQSVNIVTVNPGSTLYISRLAGLRQAKSEYVLFLHDSDQLLPSFKCSILKVDGKPDVISSVTINSNNQLGNFIFKKSLFDDYLNQMLFPIFFADFAMLQILQLEHKSFVQVDQLTITKKVSSKELPLQLQFFMDQLMTFELLGKKYREFAIQQIKLLLQAKIDVELTNVLCQHQSRNYFFGFEEKLFNCTKAAPSCLILNSSQEFIQNIKTTKHDWISLGKTDFPLDNLYQQAVIFDKYNLTPNIYNTKTIQKTNCMNISEEIYLSACYALQISVLYTENYNNNPPSVIPHLEELVDQFGIMAVYDYFQIPIKQYPKVTSYKQLKNNLQAMSIGINCFGKMFIVKGGIVNNKMHGGKIFPYDVALNFNTEMIFGQIKENFTSFFDNLISSVITEYTYTHVFKVSQTQFVTQNTYIGSHFTHDYVQDVDNVYKRRVENFLNNKQHMIFILNSRHNLTQNTVDQLHEAMADKNMHYSVIILSNSYNMIKPDERTIIFKFHPELALNELVPHIKIYYQDQKLLKSYYHKQFKEIALFLIKRFESIFGQKIELSKEELYSWLDLSKTDGTWIDELSDQYYVQKKKRTRRTVKKTFKRR